MYVCSINKKVPNEVQAVATLQQTVVFCFWMNLTVKWTFQWLFIFEWI